MIPRIGLDMDGVLYDWDANVRRLIGKEFGVPDPGPAQVWKMTWMLPEHWAWYHEHLDEVFGEGEAVPGAVGGAEALRRITDQLSIVTSGPAESEGPKRDWLQRAGISHDDFNLLPSGHGAADHFESRKSSVLCTLYVDDGPHVVDEIIAHSTATVVLFDFPYNRGPNSPASAHNGRVLRAYDWDDVVCYASGMAARYRHWSTAEGH